MKEKVLLKLSRKKQTIFDEMIKCLPASFTLFRLPKSHAVLNNDFCDSCGESGMFVCCDSCPRSFHFSCTEPPVHPDKLPENEWFCSSCREEASQERCSKSFEFIIDNQNVEIFSLPEQQNPLEQMKNNAGKMKDKLQEPVAFCHGCGLTELHGTMVKCCSCPLSWHYDCIDPPICSLPTSPSYKWLCPLHIDHFIDLPPPKRSKKQLHPRRVLSSWDSNDGNVDILIESPWTQSCGVLSDSAIKMRLIAKLMSLKHIPIDKNE